MSKLKYIVTGTGRCGTVYMARLLTSLGIPCGHEAFFNVFSKMPVDINEINPVISHSSTTDRVFGYQGKWVNVKKLQADSSLYSVPFLNEVGVNKSPVIHLVRNPLIVMTSFLVSLKLFTDPEHHLLENFIYEHLPESREEKTAIGKVALYWLRWNQRIESIMGTRPYIRCSIDEQPSENLFFFLGKQPTNDYFSRHMNIRRREKQNIFRWQDIPEHLRKEVSNMSERYGISRI